VRLVLGLFEIGLSKLIKVMPGLPTVCGSPDCELRENLKSCCLLLSKYSGSIVLYAGGRSSKDLFDTLWFSDRSVKIQV
jgi:hypothetical protein